MKSFVSGLVAAMLLFLAAILVMYDSPVRTDQAREPGGDVHLESRT